jgi:hypothetical protein
VAVWAWTIVPLALLHGWMWWKRRPVFRFQIALDVILAVVVGPALLLGADLSTVRCLNRNRPFNEWRWDDATGFQPTHSDLVLQINPWLAETRRQLLDGELPLISDRIGGGLPLLANGQTGLWAPVYLPVWALGVDRGTTVMALWKLELAGLGAFLLLFRAWRLRWAAASVGGLCWAGGSYLMAWLLVPMGWVIAALPWCWWCVVVVLRGPARPARVVGVGLLLGWMMGCGINPETAAIVTGSALLAGLVLHPGRWRRVVSVAAVALPLTVVLAWPTFGYIGASEKLALIRLDRPNLSPPPTSVRLQALQQLAVPMIHGHPGREGWRAPYPYAAASVGIGGLALVLLATGRIRRRHRAVLWAAVANLAVAAVLAYRLPPLDALLVRLPPIDRMTLPRFAVLAAWGLALWAALATEATLRGQRRRSRWRWTAVGVIAVIALTGSPWRSSGADTFLVAVTVLAAVATIALLRRPHWLVPALAIELGIYAIGINPTAAPDDLLPRPPLVQRLVELQAAEGGRIIGLAGILPANLASRFGVADLRAYDPVRPRPYVAMLAAMGDPDPILGGPVKAAPAGLCGAWSVRFLVTPPGTAADGWQPRWADESGALWSNPRYLPELRVVGRVIAADEHEGWRLLTAESLDLATVAVVPDGSPAIVASVVALEEVRLAPARVSARASCDGPCLVVLARPWAPGWLARVDDREAPIVRANLAGLGVVVPSGKHEVELRYNPWRW